jgi:hypothetical protein
MDKFMARAECEWLAQFFPDPGTDTAPAPLSQRGNAPLKQEAATSRAPWHRAIRSSVARVLRPGAPKAGA